MFEPFGGSSQFWEKGLKQMIFRDESFASIEL
jgi:hypothetical protein